MNVTSTLLAGKVALITGSSRGIGRSIAKMLARNGATVLAHGRSKSNALDDLILSLSNDGYSAYAIVADLAEKNAASVIAQQVDQLGLDIDILVLNASVQARAIFETISSEDFLWQMNVNLRSSMNLMQAFIPQMQARRWGRVVTIGSVQQFKPHPEMMVYAASKDALMSMVRNMARSVSGDGVTVNNIAVGVVETDRNRDALADETYRTQIIQQIPVGYLGEGEDCASAVMFLCSDMARYITGVNLPVDGGMHL